MTATLTTLVSFSTVFLGGAGANGGEPLGDLIADSKGDLFGTTSIGGAGESVGTVFEIIKTAGGYAAAPTTLVSFNDGDDGGEPVAGLIADANGDLFGTTESGGANRAGTVFEIAKTPTGYASTPTTLVSFDDTDGSLPQGSLIADANGDLFGTTATGGASNDGTVFEIAKTAAGYASTPTVLVSFNVTDGDLPVGSLIADSDGNLFGATSIGDGDFGSVFEVAKTPTGYASTPITLAQFTGSGGEGSNLKAGLIADANGDLFGTTETGGSTADNRIPAGTVFEIVKTATGYSSTPTTLATFYDQSDGLSPEGGLIMDANGDLFGTTSGDTVDPDFLPANDGNVFEIKKTAAGYASTPITVATFNFLNGSTPLAGLIADGDGNLFGTTSDGGPSQPEFGDDDIGTVFEITNSGFVTTATPTTSGSIVWRNASTGGVELWSPNGSGGFTYESLSSVNTSWQIAGTGDFTGSGEDGILWRNASTGGVELWNPDGSGGFTYESLNPVNTSWQVAGTGDFTGSGDDGILWRNASTGGVELWNSNGSGGFTYEALNPVNTSWQVAGTGDFTGSGDDGILWRNASTGGVELWNSNGSGGFTYEALNPVNTSWQVAGTGDFTGSGKDGLLWRNASTGGVELWNPNGSGGFTYEALNPVNTSWQVAGTGDFTGNGADGILWRNASTGAAELWNPNGSGGFTYDNLGVVSASWVIAGHL